MQTPSRIPSPTSGGTSEALPRERAGASFDVSQLEAILYGKVGAVAARTDPWKKQFEQPPFNDDDMDMYLSYEDKWRKTMKRTSAAVDLIRNNPKLMAAHMQQRARGWNPQPPVMLLLYLA